MWVWDDTSLFIPPSLAHTLKLYEDALVRTLLVWMVQDSLHSPCFWTAWPLARPLEDNLQQQSPCASPHIIFPHYFFNVTFAVWQKMVGFNRGVRGREEEGKDAGQIGSTVVFSQCPQRIQRHEAIWTLNPPAVCQKLTLGVDCYQDWRLGKLFSRL